MIQHIRQELYYLNNKTTLVANYCNNDTTHQTKLIHLNNKTTLVANYCITRTKH